MKKSARYSKFLLLTALCSLVKSPKLRRAKLLAGMAVLGTTTFSCHPQPPVTCYKPAPDTLVNQTDTTQIRVTCYEATLQNDTLK
jgi:hypothetical protein